MSIVNFTFTDYEKLVVRVASRLYSAGLDRVLENKGSLNAEDESVMLGESVGDAMRLVESVLEATRPDQLG